MLREKIADCLIRWGDKLWTGWTGVHGRPAGEAFRCWLGDICYALASRLGFDPY